MCWLLGGKNVKLDNIVLKYEILSILLILLFHQQFVIMAAATVAIAHVQTHAGVLHFGLDLPVT